MWPRLSNFQACHTTAMGVDHCQTKGTHIECMELGKKKQIIVPLSSGRKKGVIDRIERQNE